MVDALFFGFVDRAVRKAHLLPTNRTLRLDYITHKPT